VKVLFIIFSFFIVATVQAGEPENTRSYCSFSYEQHKSESGETTFKYVLKKSIDSNLTVISTWDCNSILDNLTTMTQEHCDYVEMNNVPMIQMSSDDSGAFYVAPACG
jgi:hypothetical protein